MRCFVTGGAGFIGSNLADRLLSRGEEVVVFDNFSTGFEEFLADAGKKPGFTLVRGDLLDLPAVEDAMEGCGFVFHMAANADVRYGTLHPQKDLEQNTLATFNVLEAMRANGIKKIAFPSTGSIYGEPEIFPTPEAAPFPVQTSLYGASKLSAEGLIQAYCEGFGFSGWIFRFVSILGERYTHGHVFDFYKCLSNDPGHLHILGDGRQRKSYLYVHDCIDAMLLAVEKARDKINIFNLGVDSYCTVDASVGWITEYLSLSPRLTHAGGKRGWTGDSPFVFLDTAKIFSLGWKPRLTIREGIMKTLKWLGENRWVMERRE
ncbi:MAG: NAD-dependent epimerase/dehydratase family protein [Deltaproteobacteria bacterium]|nr:NAD-dependent epimerase/dehydratase family protein [Deltaproteobacteria bacterium]